MNPGWRRHDRFCYYYNDTDIVDFHTAWHRCAQEKAKLVSIFSHTEQAYVNTMVGGWRPGRCPNVAVPSIHPPWGFLIAVKFLYFIVKTFVVSQLISFNLSTFFFVNLSCV